MASRSPDVKTAYVKQSVDWHNEIKPLQLGRIAAIYIAHLQVFHYSLHLLAKIHQTKFDALAFLHKFLPDNPRHIL